MAGSLLTAERAHELTADVVASSGRRSPVIAPFTGEPLHELPQSSAEDLDAAAATARAAQKAWAEAGFAHRRRVLLRAHDRVIAAREELLDAVQSETGKTRGQAFEEFYQAANVIRYVALAARRTLRPRRRRGGIPAVLTARVLYRPKGLIGVITPWNYPLSLAAMDVVPALGAGNAVLHKADDQGALTVLVLRRAFLEAGLPPELWQVVCGPGDEVGSGVIDRSDYVCFTGSTKTGLVVGQRAAGRLIGASLELGGKNPLLVLAGADPEQAAADAVYAFSSSAGQLCVSAERVYVDRRVADRFVPAFAERIRSLRIGTEFDYSADVGSLATKAQFDRVTAHLDDAVAKGATVLAGGRARPDLGPYVVEPTALTGVTSEMACDRDETFGPLIAVHVVDSVDEAIALANDSEFGLNASVLGPRRAAQRVAERLDAGSVNVDEGYRASFSAVDAPMGGVKRSGLGRRNGPEGMLRFVESHTIAGSTGLLQLPRTGAEFRPLLGLMMLTLRALKALRRR